MPDGEVNLQTDLFETDMNDNPRYPSRVKYWPNAIAEDHAQALYDYLVKEVYWRQPEVTVYGKSHRIPRLQCWMADKSLDYGYSDHQLETAVWLPEVITIKRQVEQLTGQKFNSVLLNWYRNGDDKMGWHADDEVELGTNPAVATLSLGAGRYCQFRHNNHKQTYNIGLESGSLLLMKSGMQASYKHQLPARKKIQNGRISLTFRYVFSE